MRRHNIFIKYVGGFMPKENAFFPGNDTDCFHQDDDPRIEEILGLDSEQTATTTALNNRINERRKSEPATTEGFKVQENEIEQRLEPATSTDICNERVGVPFGTFGTTFQVNPAPATLPFQPNATSGHQETVQAVEQLDEEEGECLICGANAGRHIHYGGQSCYSCKAFFRRAVIDNTYHNFKCTTKTCSIDSKSWRSCKWCRFQKCLASGLKPSWVLEKKERKRRHATKVTFVTRAHQSDNALALGPATAAGGSMIWGYSADELSQLIKLANGVHSDLTKNLLNFYGNNPTLFSKVTGCIYHDTKVPYDVYVEWDMIWPITAKDVVAKVSGLEMLNPEDRMKLTCHNFPAITIFIQAVVMENRQDFKGTNMCETIQNSLLQSPPTENNEEDVRKLHYVLQSLNVGMKMPTNALKYEQLFTSPWASSSELEDRHENIIAKLAAWPIDFNDPNKPIDKSLLFLIYNIIMLSTDGLRLADESKVKELQVSHYNMLYRYLRHKYNLNVDDHFKEGMDIARLGREAHYIRAHRLPV